MSSETRTSPRVAYPGSLTAWSLAALVAGLGLGVAGNATGWPPIAFLAAVVDPFATLWIQALQMVVLPLVALQILAAVLRTSGGRGMGRVGVSAVLLFALLLAVAAVFTVLLTAPILGFYTPDPAAVDAIRGTVTGAQAATAASASASAGTTGFIPTILAPNLFQAAADGEVLPVLLFSLALGLAISSVPARRTEGLTQGILSLAEAFHVLVRWIILATPVGVFGITLGFARSGGATTAGVAFVFVLMQSGMLVAFTLVLYPITSVAGGRSLAELARALLPPQLVAVTTRSSIASLPAMVEEAENTLRLPQHVSGLVLPLAVAVFKQNRTVSAPFKLLFVAYVFGVPLAPGQIVVFVLTVMLLSVSALGVPGGGRSFTTLPAYLAAGLPIEAILLLEAVDTIPDIFKTLVNVTADMAVAVILAGPWLGRFFESAGGSPVSAAPEAAPGHAGPEGMG